MKKLFCIFMAVVSVFSFSACTKAADYNPGSYYEYEKFEIEDLSTLFKNLSGDTVFSSNIGTVSGKSFSLDLGKSNASVEITAKGKKTVTTKFEIDVKKQSFEDLYASYDETVKKYLIRSAKITDAVMDNYWNIPASLGLHYFPNYLTEKPEGMVPDNSTAFVWPYTEMAAALWRQLSIEPSNAKQQFFYKAVLEGFEYYLADRKDYHAYVATRSNEIGGAAGDTYYDDNIWIAREFLNAFEVLNDESYLTKSLEVCDYIWSGWAGDEIGGIYWKEQEKTSRNACSNAPAIILFSRLYEITNEQKWLDRAKACYEFVNTHLVDDDGVVEDNISNTGSVDGHKYTYNSGSFISGALKLYEITKEGKYLTAANFTAAGSDAYFFKSTGRSYKTITMHSPWFNVLLLDGYIELYKHNKTALGYIETYQANLDHAYANFVNEQGLMSTNWVNGGFGTKLNVLDMAANAENFGQLAHFYLSIKSAD